MNFLDYNYCHNVCACVLARDKEKMKRKRVCDEWLAAFAFVYIYMHETCMKEKPTE